MAEVLSQAEIDDLLSSLSSGEAEVEDIERQGKLCRSYDFRRPRKFAKDCVRTLQLLMETFARQFGNNLAGLLRVNAKCSIDSIEQLTYEEFARSMLSPTLICVVSVQPNGGAAIVEMSLPVAFGVLERMLGGPGAGVSPNRELTEIEESLVEDIFRQMLAQMSAAWSELVEVDFRFERLESRPQFAQVIPPNETVLNICLDTTIGLYEGYINICLPFNSISHIVESLGAEAWLVSAGPAAEGGEAVVMRDDLLLAVLPLAVELGRTRITLSELKDLGEGQVVRLERGVDEPVLVRVGGRSAFFARPGTRGRAIAVQLQRGAGAVHGDPE